LTDRNPFSVQTEKKKKKERAVEDAIEKIYGFGLSIFAKQDTRQVHREKSKKWELQNIVIVKNKNSIET
jgi:hypothetical protein